MLFDVLYTSGQFHTQVLRQAWARQPDLWAGLRASFVDESSACRVRGVRVTATVIDGFCVYDTSDTGSTS